MIYYEEIFLGVNIQNKLNKIIETIGYDKTKVEKNLYQPKITMEHAKHRTSNEVLEELIAKGNVDVATQDCNLLKFNNIKFDFIGQIIAVEMKERFCGYGLSGRIWYPPAGYMGWHTNNNNQGHKLYCAYAKEGGKSFFRYRHPETHEIITSWDKEGWNFRIFTVKEQLLWHCVYSETDRFSIGYTLKEKTP
jgi:hypothetical protein